MEEVAVVNIKKLRVYVADKLEAWGERNGVYSIPQVSTKRLMNEILRTPIFTNKEKHIRAIVSKFTVTQPASIGLILSEIKEAHPIEYTIALSEYEAIRHEP